METPSSPTRTVVVGVTMGDGWSGFPHLLAPDYAPVNPPYEKLDVELPLYVTWITDWNHTGDPPQPQPVNPPQPLSSFSWFAGHHGEFWVTQVAQLLQDDDGYNACPTGGGLEAPVEGVDQFPLTSDGKLRVTDTHGGIGDITRIHLVKETCCVGGLNESYNIVFQWDRPLNWYDSQLGMPVDFTPGMTRHDRINIVRNGTTVSCWMPTRIVEWASTDLGIPGASGPSPRYVDASDLAYWYSHCNPELGHLARFGFSSETPPYSPTYNCNVVPWRDSMAVLFDEGCGATFNRYHGRIARPVLRNVGPVKISVKTRVKRFPEGTIPYLPLYIEVVGRTTSSDDYRCRSLGGLAVLVAQGGPDCGGMWESVGFINLASYGVPLGALYNVQIAFFESLPPPAQQFHSPGFSCIRVTSHPNVVLARTWSNVKVLYR